MRIDVYRAGQLAATFVHGQAPVYHGALGRQVRALIETPHRMRNPWTGEEALDPPDESPGWWAANVLYAGLGVAGFSLHFTNFSFSGPSAGVGVADATA